MELIPMSIRDASMAVIIDFKDCLLGLNALAQKSEVPWISLATFALRYLSQRKGLVFQYNCADELAVSTYGNDVSDEIIQQMHVLLGRVIHRIRSSIDIKSCQLDDKRESDAFSNPWVACFSRGAASTIVFMKGVEYDYIAFQHG